MLFSLIVPFYNVEKYIGKCLDSIEAQIYRDFEVILVDDGSQDDTGRIVDAFILGKEKHYRLLKQKNCGLSGARNNAMKSAKGEYLIFIDSDDWIAPDYLSSMESIIRKYSPDIIRSACYRDNAEEQIITQDIPGEAKFLDKYETMEKLLMDRIGSQVWLNVCRSDLWKGIEFPEGLLFEDLYTTHRVFAEANSIYFCDKPFYHYVSRLNSISTAPKFGRAKSIYFGFKNRYEWSCEHEQYAQIKPEMFRKVWLNLLQYIHDCVRFQQEIPTAKSECQKIMGIAKDNHYEIPLSKRMEMSFFVRANEAYQKMFSAVRR